MSRAFAVVHEADADFQTATEVADRVLIDAIDWLDDSVLEYQRTWVSHTPGGERLTWKRIKQLARDAGVDVEGHIDNQPAFPDAKAARRAILYLLSAFAELDGVVLIRDQDDQPERRIGLEQARGEHHGKPVIVVGLAVVEREAWVISGLEPQNADEQARLDAERQTLGFNPCERSHELTACKDDTAKRSPKRVLHILSGGDHDRQRRWTERRPRPYPNEPLPGLTNTRSNNPMRPISNRFSRRHRDIQESSTRNPRKNITVCPARPQSRVAYANTFPRIFRADSGLYAMAR